MGKAARRRNKEEKALQVKDPAQLPAAFNRRPFAELADESIWVAIRELVPAATFKVDYKTPEGETGTATIASILPASWSGLKRTDGEVVVALQTVGTTGDAARDVAATLLATHAAEPGTSLASIRATAATPALESLITGPISDLEVHEGFDFWVATAELNDEAAQALAEANASAAPTVKLREDLAVFWVRFADRAFIRWVLPTDEDTAINGLARLHAAGESTLGGGRLLGAFRTQGVLIPVWEVDVDAEPTSWTAELDAIVERTTAAVAVTEPLTPEQRGAKNGLLSRQVVLR